MSFPQITPVPTARTLGELKALGWKSRGVKEELRENLLAALRSGAQPFPGIVGYEKTVIPQVQNALLAGHDFILLGLRGQAKTRMLRQLPALLDEWMPALAGTSLREDPFAPISPAGRALVEKAGDAAPIEWIHRSDRYHEKLATPDVSMADLIGDVDPIKASRERLDLSDEEVIHWGLIPRSNRGIFAINELPDLQARIQVGLFNLLEENDIQIRGFPLRLPLDLLLTFSANPEDYTHRGSIITPLKDRIASQILTHYPANVQEAALITRSQMRRKPSFDVPTWAWELLEEISFQARASEYVDQSSGVSARVGIAAAENLVAQVERRAALLGEEPALRLVDFYGVIPAVTGKVELVHEGDQQGPVKVARILISQAMMAAFLKRFPKPPRKGKEDPEKPQKKHAYTEILHFFGEGGQIAIDDAIGDAEHRKNLESVKPLVKLVEEHAKEATGRERLLLLELVLEGLHAHQYVSRKDEGGRVEFLDVFSSMFKGLRG